MPASALSLGKKAWEQYLEKEVVDSEVVRNSVANSWQRCRALQVNPRCEVERDFESTPVLERRLDDKERLIEIARPFMRDLCGLLNGTDFQVVLTDESGLLLEVMGDKKILSRTREVQLCPGATWSEAQKGTNAIGTALVERAPVQIFAWEHFREENQFLTCSAAPISTADGRILGVLDVSGDCRQANPHTLGMVVAIARAIESQLRLAEATHELHVLTRYSNVLMHGVTDGLLAVNDQGIVLDINARGGQILGVNPVTAKGASLDRISLGNSPIIQVIHSGQEYENQPIIIDCNGKQIRSSASPVRDESGKVVGAVAFFHEIQERQNSRKSLVFHSHRSSFDDIVGDSAAISVAKDWGSLAAGCNSTVLLLGESGTGKEVFATAIHSASARSHAPFLAINCAAMPETLIESELFGFSDGSFTGARKGGQAGKFELADGGTVFLDEIGEMSAPMQAKLLRVLQERTVQRIGSSHEMKVDIRIIAATHRDLSKDVEDGRFREDLYYRIAVLEVKIPPLRERTEDIPALARCLVNRICRRLERPPVDICDECLRKLATYAWPGNVREMENVLERAIISLRGAGCLQAENVTLPANSPQCRREKQSPPEGAPSESRPSARSLREAEKEAIVEALRSSGGNIKRAAARLGIARNTLYRKMEDYALVSEDKVLA
jgi:transcriptional regulator of acetoin/glycerol metabolism